MIVTTRAQAAPSPDGRLMPMLLIGAIVLLAVHALAGSAAVLEGVLVDTDSYMRLNRVIQLWQSGAWFDTVYPRINPPLGHEQHWTRPLDVWLLAGAWLASPAAGFEKALYWWAALTGPVLQIMTLCALVWAARPLLQRQWLWLLVLVFAAQPSIFQVFVLGRPDHHSAIVFLTTILIGLTIRLLLNPDRRGPAIWAGIVSALCIWISIETLPTIAISLAILALMWLRGERRLGTALLAYSLTAFLAMTAALLAERGFAQFGRSEFDRISISHIELFGLNLAFWFGAAVLARSGTALASLRGRLLWTLTGATLGGLALWLLQPGFFGSPLANVDDLYRRVRLVRIQELQPAIRPGALDNWTWRELVFRPLFWLGLAIPAIPWLVYRILGGPPEQRSAWSFLGLCAAFFVPLSVIELRWSPYGALVLLPAYADLVAVVVGGASARLGPRLLPVVRPLLIAFLCMWYYAPLVISKAGTASPKAAAALATETCSVKRFSAFLNDPVGGLGSEPKRLLALVDFGPELLYRTAHSVFSIPNHRYQQGFTASYRIMAAEDFDAAAALAAEFRVEMIAICPTSVEDTFYKPETGGRTLYRALAEGDVPDFLTPRPVPRELAGGFRLFEVRPAGD